MTMLKELDSYDWAEAFQYAQGFTREDVRMIYGIREGENDGANWLIYGKLHDGRWFALSAGCDYTGWDCQAGGNGSAYATRDEMLRFGMDREMREHFKRLLPEEKA